MFLGQSAIPIPFPLEANRHNLLICIRPYSARAGSVGTDERFRERLVLARRVWVLPQPFSNPKGRKKRFLFLERTKPEC
jgi:hypothetical protein